MESNLGQKVKVARENKGMSQAELAERAGLTQQALSKIENDKVENPPISTIALLGLILDDDFQINKVKQVIDQIINPHGLATLVNRLDKGILGIEWFVFELSEKNERFRRMLTKKALSTANKVKNNLLELFEAWDDDYEQKRKEMYDHINSRPELVERLLREQKKRQDNDTVKVSSFEEFDEVTKEYAKELESDGNRKTA